MVIGGTGDSEVLVPGSCRLNSIGAAFMATSPGSSDIRDKVELYIMEVGHVEWTPTDFITWIGERSPNVAQQLGQSHASPGDTVSNRQGGWIAKSISQQLANETRPENEGNYPIHRPRRGWYQVIEEQIQVIIERQQHRVDPVSENIDSSQIEEHSTEQSFTENDPSPLITLPNQLLEYIGATEASQNEENTPTTSPAPTEGYLYLVYNEHSFQGWVKAGHSSTENRINQYQTGDPHRAYRSIAYAGIQATDDMSLIQFETQFHILLLNRATGRGTPSQTGPSEWFQIPHSEAIQVLEELHPESFILAPDYVPNEENEM